MERQPSARSAQQNDGGSFVCRKPRPWEEANNLIAYINRTYLVNPSSGNPLATRTFNALGEPTGGFGYVNPTATPPQLPRSGQIVARFEF